jgi:hypothetical protein
MTYSSTQLLSPCGTARKIIRGLKDGPSEEERYAVADHVVRQLKERGESWAVRRRSKARKGADNVSTAKWININVSKALS